MQKILSVPALLILLLSSCSAPSTHTLQSGTWRAVLTMQGRQLPFGLEIKHNDTTGYSGYIQNGKEHLPLDSIWVQGDSVKLQMYIFDANIVAYIDGDSLKGTFTKPYADDYYLPFFAVRNQDWRFAKTDTTLTRVPSFAGKYATTFTNEYDTTQAIGVFQQKGNHVTGSFVINSGDDRFLEGNVIGDTLYLSTFDGNHTFVFTATHQSDSILIGDYWSGKTFHQQWTGIRNENATLPDADKITYLKPGYDRFTFSFPDSNGKIISSEDEQFRGKALIVDIMGTWCPNCMDETRFLTDWYKQADHDKIAIVSLAYERKADFGYASGRVKNMIRRMGITYPVLIAGVNDASAAKTLPMLNGISAYPTTIFVDPKGKIRKIHTGFSGPGTGSYYEEFKGYFKDTIDQLLAE